MAWGDASSPARFGQGQHVSDDRNLFLKVASGEVLTAYTERVIMRDKHQVRSITSGKEVQFPKTWKATSEYHTAGAEMLGNDIDTTEVTITVDGKLVAHTAIYDLDAKIAHFDVTGEFNQELGRELARAFDKNVMRAVILAARKSADGPFPGGNIITDAALANSGAIDGEAWIDAIREANIALFNKDVPEDQPRYMAVNRAVFDAIKYAKDANGRYLVLSRDLGGNGSVANRPDTLDVDGVTVMALRTLPSADETAVNTVYPKYRANYSKTKGLLWTPMAVGTVVIEDVGMETERDVRRQEDFMVAKMAVGHGTLRPECAVEFAIP
jgi:hypothetical protein